MATVEDHLTRFYALGGETTSDVAKNYKLFENTLSQQTFNTDAFFSTVKPKNFRQELFRLKLLGKYNRHDELLQTLLNGSNTISKLTLRDSGLIKLLASMRTEDLLKQIFERLSFSARTQLINKLSLSVVDEVDGCELYKAVLGKYGMKAAVPLLIACAEEVIIEAIEENDVKFKHRELMRCYRKSPGILEVYFRKNNNFERYPKLGQYLCTHDLARFNGLLEFGVPKIGKKAFIRYLRVYKEEFVKDANKLLPLLRRGVLSKQLSEVEFVEWIKNILPGTGGLDFSREMEKYLKMIPYGIRGRVFFAAFKNRYGFDVWSIRDYISDELMEILPLEDRRRFELINCIEYESVGKALPVLQHQLSLTNRQNERMSVVKKVVMNCKINDDYDALLEVLRNFTRNQKNENKHIRYEFIDLVTELFEFQKFSEEHWRFIDEIIMQFRLNGEYVYVVGDTLKKYIEYKIINGLDYTLQLKLFCKHRGLYDLPSFSEKPEEQRAVILKFLSLIDELFTQESDKKIAHITFVEAALRFNRKHRHEFKMCTYRHSLGIVTDNLKEDYPRFFALRDLLKCLQREGENDDLLTQLFLTGSKKYQPNTLSWFLWKRPNIIANNIEALFKHHVLHSRFCYELSKLENSSLRKGIVDYALEVVKVGGEDSALICSSLRILSFCHEVNLDEYTKRWIPTDFKIDVHKDDTKYLLDIQKTLLSTYKTRPCLQEVIPDILHFCNGDYQQYALEPLYYFSSNVPECDLIVVLNKLLKRSVSIRKHTLHLVTRLASLESKRVILISSAKTEKNASVKRLIVKKLCSCLQDGRTEADWDFFSSHLHFVDRDDTEIIAEILCSQNIPKKFYTKFVCLLWRHLSERGKSEQFQLLASLDYNKFTIGDDSCKEIVSKSLFNPANKFTEKTHAFTYNYLITSTMESLETKVEFIWKCIQASSLDPDPYEFKKILHEFFYFICKQVLQKNSKPGNNEKIICKQVLQKNSKPGNNEKIICKQVLQKDLEPDRHENVFEAINTMQDLLPTLEPTCCKFRIGLLLECTKLCRSVETKSFAKHVADKLKILLSEYGILIIKIYSKFLADFLKLIVEESFTLDVLEELLKFDDSTETRVFCIHLLASAVPKHKTLRNKYFNVMKKLEEDCSAIVSIELEKHVLDLSL